MKTIKYILLSTVLIGFTACNDEEDFDMSEDAVVLPELTVGSLDLSNYVAVGASFTAGFTDNALFIAGQENSFPNQLATQFAKAGGGSFSQPLMNDNIGGLLFNGMPAPDGSFGPRLFFNGAGPAVLPGMSTTEATNNLGGTFNNVGVPGAKSFHIPFEGYGALNPYFGRMASSPTASMLGDALTQSPTFFTLSEIGGNDVLSYATSGGVGVDQTGNINPLTYGINDITDPNVFAQSFSVMVTALTQNGAKGVVTTVPDITSLSHFTSISHNPIPLDAATAGALNAGYATYNGGLQFALANGLLTAEEAATRTIVFEESESNTMVLIDEALTDLTSFGIPSFRQSTSADLFVLPLASLIPQGYGTQIQLEDKWVLTPEEQASIATATAAYNSTIQSVADANPNVAVADLRAVLEQAATIGYPYDDYTMTTDLVFGGLVSLDGVHLTARGYGLMAREFLVAMDAAFGSNFIASGSAPAAGLLPTNYGPTL
ncbi:G-D-S-L family lipolytic protein [Flavobacteriales bacterium 33_180_T64]|nr:G-D-S-L family lipolytic protein [Flavobacteriales bacterium 33_180_T64]